MELQTIQNKIYEIRGQQVMLDFDLAALYQVETKVLKLSFKELYSSFEISNIKSSGNRSIFRRTACFKTFVST